MNQAWRLTVHATEFTPSMAAMLRMPPTGEPS